MAYTNQRLLLRALLKGVWTVPFAATMSRLLIDIA